MITIEQASILLNVSYGYTLKLLDEGVIELTWESVGRYKVSENIRIQKDLAELSKLGQEQDKPHDKYEGKLPHQVRGWNPNE